MSMVSLAQEAAHLVHECRLTLTDLARMSMAAADRSFLPAPARTAARRTIEDWAAEHGAA
jgi:hypothetical protein